jgi:SIR2-like domain/TIR domain
MGTSYTGPGGTRHRQADIAPSASAPEKREDVAPPPDAAHCELVLEHMTRGGDLVLMLGSGLAGSRGAWREGCGLLPDAEDIAAFLAEKVNLTSPPRELAGVAQYVRMIRGEPNVFRWVKQILTADCEPGPLHRFLARFPKWLEELGLEKRYQMIVTTNFDNTLERAFREEGEPFDVAVYMAPGTEYAGRFVHLPLDADPRPVVTPHEYADFPIDTDYELTRTLIVKIHGTVDDPSLGYSWKGNLVITEDHFIDYLSGSSVESIVPVQILNKLRDSHCLFLGYTMSNWTQRVFLRRIWRGIPLGATSWAVEQDPDVLERKFWAQSNVDLYSADLAEYVDQLHMRLTGRQPVQAQQSSETDPVQPAPPQPETGAPATGGIFISYRREDTAPYAGRLYDRLVSRFGEGRVFIDIDSIPLGDNFDEVITSKVGSCDVLLALIGDEWLTSADEDGRRLDNPDDFVRLEIAAAVERNIRVIPILVEGARMPRAKELPPSLMKLARRQALDLSTKRFSSDANLLIMELEKTLTR